MKKLKNTLIISSYVLLVALFFTGGYALGKIGTGKDVTTAPLPTMRAAMANAEPEIKSPVYELIIEDGILKIYKCIGDEKTVITSEGISESVFPKDDIEELKKGVKFERLEAAQQMFENFVS
ncbi:MAG: hypothetical protein ACI4A5_07130 [Hominilimicola sp.]